MKNALFGLLLLLLFVTVTAFILQTFGVLDDVWYTYISTDRPPTEYPVPDPKTTAEFLQMEYGKLLDERIGLDKEREQVEIEKRRLDETIQKNAKNLANMQKIHTEIIQKEEELKKLNISIQKTESQIQTVKDTMTDSSAMVTDDELLKIVNIYNKMNAKKAATILSNMDDAFLVRLFSLMKPAVVGKILTEFPAQRAAGLSKRLKG